MTAIRWIPGTKVKAALREVDPQCHLLMGLSGPFHLWATSWGHHFSVQAIGPESMCSEAELERILQDIERRRP